MVMREERTRVITNKLIDKPAGPSRARNDSSKFSTNDQVKTHKDVGKLETIRGNDGCACKHGQW
jgi:hypothetical protein